MSMDSRNLESGRGIQVVTPAPEHTFTLNEKDLRALLLREDVRDLPVVIISVAGALRKGKSFLLDFFLRYLHQTYESGASGEWLGSEDEPLRGFSWRGGSDRDTTGLLLWSQPFKASLANGEKVVILLMDTQGTFDSESTVKDNATVFALSTMLSSVQIYNLSQNIEEDDLQHLQLFTDYGRLAKQSSGGKPFQRLQFLIRDWSFPYEHPYGRVGGEQLLKKRLAVHEGQHEQLQSLRRHIAACFEELDCFLMPHPGLNVATNPNFDGKLSDISEEFKVYLKQLVQALLSPENLVPKQIEGQRVKAKEVLHYMKAYMEVFNGNEMPEPKSMLDATAEANNLAAVAEAREVYEDLMEEACGGTRPYLDPRRLQQEHQRARDKALHAFHSRKKMGGDLLAKTYSMQLLKELEEQFEQLRLHNEAKNLFRIAGTPLVFLCVAVLAYLASMAATAVALPSLLVTVAQTAAMVALGMLLVWGYTRITGNMSDIGMQLDEIANSIRNCIMQQTWSSVKNGPTEEPVANDNDDDKNK